MANKILIIGVGSAGVIAADKMNLPNSKKLFVDSDCSKFNGLEPDGEKLLLQCKVFGECSGFCHCYHRPEFCKKVAHEYENQIRELIKNAFEDEGNNIGD